MQLHLYNQRGRLCDAYKSAAEYPDTPDSELPHANPGGFKQQSEHPANEQ